MMPTKGDSPVGGGKAVTKTEALALEMLSRHVYGRRSGPNGRTEEINGRVYVNSRVALRLEEKGLVRFACGVLSLTDAGGALARRTSDEPT